MKKSLLALAVLGAFAGAASAQSSVTLYGRVDLSVGKNMGSAAKVMQNGSGSRLGVRGVEDLGGGTSAFFQVEHRFDADTGASQNFGICPTGVTAPDARCNLNRFWGGRSIVGFQGGFGKVTLGREYTTAFFASQLAADPWGWDTVASGLTVPITGGGIARVRNDSSLTYNFAASGFSFGAQIAEATDAINNFQKKPINVGLGYSAGPLTLGVGYERTGQEAAAAAKWTTFNAAYNFGPFKLGGFIGSGTTAANASNRAWMLSGTAPMGNGEFRAAFGKLSTDPAGAVGRTDAAKGFAVGYHYSLSKRTTVYADFVRDTARATEKTGYDFGVKHNF